MLSGIGAWSRQARPDPPRRAGRIAVSFLLVPGGQVDWRDAMRRAASWTWIGLTLLGLGTRCSSQGSLPAQGQGGSEYLAGRTGGGGMGTGGEIGISGGSTGSGGKGMGGTPLE